ncbi:MAG TPA: hypothetical protein VLA49_08610 [Anaerolineales bacterium]|nr:hypothetical protein [Anaerolineales bacterium]
MTSKLNPISPKAMRPSAGFSARLPMFFQAALRLDRRIWIVGALLVVAFIAFLALVQFATPSLAGTDGYYHIKFASLMRTQGLKPEFTWLPLTVLNAREFYDHHFLFHVALIPFTLGDLLQGAKSASIVFAGLAFLSIWWFFHQQRLPHAALWALGLLGISEAFIYRVSMVRVQSLSILVLVLGLHWMLTKKYHYLVPLGFLYVWLYDAFPLLLAFAALYTFALLISERRLDFRPVLYASLGIGLGMLINPYFPDNLVFVYRHLLPKLSDATAVSVGNEWYPYETAQLMENSPLALVAFISGVFALGLKDRRMDTRTAAALFIAVMFGVMLFQARRFIEYFPPFALIFAALAWAGVLKTSPAPLEAQEASTSSARLRLGRLAVLRQWLPAFLIAVMLLPGMVNTFGDARSSLRGSTTFERYARASAWLQGNTPFGSRVFQTDWDDFPRLFYYNTHNSYLLGLDPTYMQLYDIDLYDLWVEITQGDVERPSEYIYPRFGAQYVLTDHRHADFIQVAAEDPGLKQVYEDKDAIIYEVIE